MDLDIFNNIVSLKKCDNNFKVICKNEMTKDIVLSKYDSKDFFKNIEKELINKFISSTILYCEDYNDIYIFIHDTFRYIKPTSEKSEKFLITHKDSNIKDVLIGIKIFKTNYINKDEIIFGYKNKFNEEGISIFYKEDTLDSDKISLLISKIGFNPGCSYRRFKI